MVGLDVLHLCYHKQNCFGISVYTAEYITITIIMCIYTYTSSLLMKLMYINYKITSGVTKLGQLFPKQVKVILKFLHSKFSEMPMKNVKFLVKFFSEIFSEVIKTSITLIKILF